MVLDIRGGGGSDNFYCNIFYAGGWEQFFFSQGLKDKQVKLLCQNQDTQIFVTSGKKKQAIFSVANNLKKNNFRPLPNLMLRPL